MEYKVPQLLSDYGEVVMVSAVVTTLGFKRRVLQGASQ